MSIEEETTAFKNLIFALYGKPYTLESVEDLLKLCKLADYYLAIPAISRTISDACNVAWFNHDYTEILISHPERLLDVAVKLHHKKLFQDCMIHIVGKCQEFSTLSHNQGAPVVQDYGELETSLNKVANTVRRRIDRQLAHIHALLVRDRHTLRDLHENVSATSCWSLPSYYRTLYFELCKNNEYSYELGLCLKQALELILRNNLSSLNPTGHRVGEGAYVDYFLCGEVKTEELPWDPEADDW